MVNFGGIISDDMVQAFQKGFPPKDFVAHKNASHQHNGVSFAEMVTRKQESEEVIKATTYGYELPEINPELLSPAAREALRIKETKEQQEKHAEQIAEAQKLEQEKKAEEAKKHYNSNIDGLFSNFDKNLPKDYDLYKNPELEKSVNEAKENIRKLAKSGENLLSLADGNKDVENNLTSIVESQLNKLSNSLALSKEEKEAYENLKSPEEKTEFLNKVASNRKDLTEEQIKHINETTKYLEDLHEKASAIKDPKEREQFILEETKRVAIQTKVDLAKSGDEKAQDYSQTIKSVDENTNKFTEHKNDTISQIQSFAKENGITFDIDAIKIAENKDGSKVVSFETEKNSEQVTVKITLNNEQLKQLEDGKGKIQDLAKITIDGEEFKPKPDLKAIAAEADLAGATKRAETSTEIDNTGRAAQSLVRGGK
jgi:hypothetical protein